ncbi:MAG TPA: hypothetical protein VET27_05740, partial [Mycobacterium sp.]|nr:hypothetical protein [Mycobacterium sp.]
QYAQLTDPPPADPDGLGYDTDLLTLAGQGEQDPKLEAELASFKALLTEGPTHPTPTDLEETR